MLAIKVLKGISIVASPTAVTGVGVMAGRKIEQLFPPKGEIHEVGETVTVDGKERVVIGYTGHAGETLKKGLDPEKGIWFADKGTAQEYAISNSILQGDPRVGLVVGDAIPKSDDLGPSRYYEGYAPLTAEGYRRLHIEVINPEPVTAENQLGVIPSIQRALSGTLPTS